MAWSGESSCVLLSLLQILVMVQCLSQELYLAFREELRATPVWVEGAGHNDVESLLYPEGRFWEIINRFLVEHCSCSPVPRGNRAADWAVVGQQGAVELQQVREHGDGGVGSGTAAPAAPTFGEVFNGRGSSDKAGARF